MTEVVSPTYLSRSIFISISLAHASATSFHLSTTSDEQEESLCLLYLGLEVRSSPQNKQTSVWPSLVLKWSCPNPEQGFILFMNN